MKAICNEKAQGKTCCLELYHDGVHEDSSGFRFIDERWPNHMGNGPNGYPMNNPAWDKAVAANREARQADVEKYKEFTRKLRNAIRAHSKKLQDS